MSLYHNIANSLLDKIKNKEWIQGHMIPSEKELCDQFSVSRPTVRAALSVLVNQGYLERVKGKGSFVSKPKVLEDTTVFQESFSRGLLSKGVEVQTEVLEQRMIEADETVAMALGVQVGEEVVKLVRLRYVESSFDEGPIVYNISYLPSRLDFVTKCNFEEESLTNALNRHNVKRRYLEKDIRAILLEGKIARILGVSENSLGILISSICREEDRSSIVEYTLSYYPSDRNSFILKISL